MSGRYISGYLMLAACGGGMVSAQVYPRYAYAGGFSMNSSDVMVPGCWKNGAWTGLTPLDATKGSQIMALVVVAQ